MLRFEIEDVFGGKEIWDDVLALCINEEEDVPADDMTAVFPLKNTAEISRVTLFDGDEAVFSGVVDEQQRIISESGMFFKLTARSMAALLLDNESVPVTYNHPTAGLIAQRHIIPHGLQAAGNMDSAFFGELVITKGESEWSAVERFCKNCFRTFPRVNADKTLDLMGLSSKGKIKFSNDGDGERFTRFFENVKRCEEISKVNIKVDNAAGYVNAVENPEAGERKLERVRYINAALTQTPMTCADTMIENGRKKGYTVTLSCPKRHLGILGKSASVKAGDDVIDGLYVTAVRYVLSEKKETTEVTLKRRV